VTGVLMIAEMSVHNIPLLSLSENNNRSNILKLLCSRALSFYFLTVIQVCSQNLEMEALKGFQRLGSTKVTKEGYIDGWIYDCVRHRHCLAETITSIIY
jgi:hypothetical protein